MPKAYDWFSRVGKVAGPVTGHNEEVLWMQGETEDEQTCTFKVVLVEDKKEDVNCLLDIKAYFDKNGALDLDKRVDFALKKEGESQPKITFSNASIEW
jgi:D-hexose-6-phosphate mutarotase